MGKKWNSYVAVAIVVIVGIAIAVALIVNSLSPKVRSEITAGDMLTYIGTILSVIGTTALAIITVYLSKQANKITERQASLEESNTILQLTPFVILSNVKCEDIAASEIKTKCQFPTWRLYDADKELDYNERYYRMYWIRLFNSTNYFLTAKYMGFFYGERTGENYNRITDDNVLDKANIKKNDEGVIGLYASNRFWSKHSRQLFTLVLGLENRFAEKYVEQITFVYSNDKTSAILYPLDKKNIVGPLDILFTTTNYKIEKVSQGNK
jgi:hypothetical protein